MKRIQRLVETIDDYKIREAKYRLRSNEIIAEIDFETTIMEVGIAVK